MAIKKGKKLSEEHKRNKKMSKSHIGKSPINKGRENKKIQGKNHHNWKGGITPINHIFRTSMKARIWRETVFRRDDFTCQNPNCKYCHNEIGIRLNAHHIKPVYKFPELMFDVDNGITYCEGYHLKSGLHKRRFD